MYSSPGPSFYVHSFLFKLKYLLKIIVAVNKLIVTSACQLESQSSCIIALYDFILRYLS